VRKETANIKSPEQLKELYGKEYVEMFTKIHSPFRMERFMKYIHLNTNYYVADYGCGNGMLMPLVASKVASYVGVDFSEEFIRKANEKKCLFNIANAEFFCSDIVDFCDKHPESFDCAFAMDFSEHVYDDEWVKILTSIRMSLKEGGSLYIHTPNALFFIEILKARSLFMHQYPEHIGVRSPNENAELLIKAGYSIKKVMLIPHYNFLKFLHFFSYIPFFGKYFKARIFIEAIK
jgi:2-polyprenyl-6-hydroxyphenyl methylase / 3-demethylubiquinone-9 3-methyltransferase